MPQLCGRSIRRGARESALICRCCLEILLEHEELRLENSILLPALRACAWMKDLESGARIHSIQQQQGGMSVYAVTSLIDMYAKCRRLENARAVLERMPCHSTPSWNALLLGFVENGENELVLRFFENIQQPDSRTFVAALKACAGLAARIDEKLERGMRIHSLAENAGYDLDKFVIASLIHMYAKCGRMVEARHAFEKTPHRDVVLWTALMLGFVENGECEMTMELFESMRGEGCVSNGRTFVAVLMACVSLSQRELGVEVEEEAVKIKSLQAGMSVHARALENGCADDFFVASSLIDMYSSCGSLIDARAVFDRMRHLDVVVWTCLILGYVRNGKSELALELYEQMEEQGCPRNSRTFVAGLMACVCMAATEEGSEVTGRLVRVKSLEKCFSIHSQAVKAGVALETFVSSTLVDAYTKCGSLLDARSVFDQMEHHDVVSWTSLLLAYVESRDSKFVLELFATLKQTGLDTSSTLAAVLMACRALVAIEAGREVHGWICRKGLEGGSIVNSLVDFYGKCGSIVDAQQLFDTNSRNDIVLWNSLIAGHSHQGDAARVLELFRNMINEGMKPDSFTFVSILAACSGAGSVDQGMKYFRDMWKRYGVAPNIHHYSCLVDLFGRASYLEEAVAVDQAMPFKQDSIAKTTLLAACSKWRDVKVGQVAFERAMKMGGGTLPSSAHSLMANILASAGGWKSDALVVSE